MTRDEFDSLHEGDVVRHVSEAQAFIVHANYGRRIVAIRAVELSNPEEWDLIFKAEHKRIND